MSATLTVLASGSSANGYIIQANNEALILEAGVPFKECAKALAHDISKVKAVICSHGHKDHSAYIKQYQQHGLSVYSNADVASNVDGVVELESMKKYHFGRFTVIPLRVPHGDCPNFAYHITLPDRQTLLFATDLERFGYNAKGINHICIEANFSDDIRIDAMLNGAELRAQSRNHMEIGETIATISRLKSPELVNVVLLHLSDNLSDAEDFKKRIFAECGVHTEVAEKNIVISLAKADF